jgi:hypothetical protein
MASLVDPLQAFPLFCPYSGGEHEQKSLLTVQTIQQCFPFLSSFAAAMGRRQLEVAEISSFPKTDADFRAAEDLKALFDQQGSDKSNFHNYQLLYGPILANRAEIAGVLEIGLGTNNIDVVSNMGSRGRPGASLRAFRSFLPHANIYGADVDKRVLFEEERIKTYFVDQTDPATFESLGRMIPPELDLVIDDGLHSPNANIATLKFGLSKIKLGGWVVVEDISPAAQPFWEVVNALLPDRFKGGFFRAELGNLFAVRRVSRD